jgi:hypothetical protein
MRPIGLILEMLLRMFSLSGARVFGYAWLRQVYGLDVGRSIL